MHVVLRAAIRIVQFPFYKSTPDYVKVALKNTTLLYIHYPGETLKLLPKGSYCLHRLFGSPLGGVSDICTKFEYFSDFIQLKLCKMVLLVTPTV